MNELAETLKLIRDASGTGFAPLAVSTALSLPDICVSLADPNDSKGNRGVRYMEWCDENIMNKFPYLTSNDLWSLRCGVSHSGRYTGDGTTSFEKYGLLLQGGLHFDSCVLNDMYTESAHVFCEKFCSAADSWLESNKSDPTVRKNLSRLVRVHPKGLEPYVKGIAIIA